MEARFHFPAGYKESLVIVFGLQKIEHQNSLLLKRSSHFSVKNGVVFG